MAAAARLRADMPGRGRPAGVGGCPRRSVGSGAAARGGLHVGGTGGTGSRLRPVPDAAHPPDNARHLAGGRRGDLLLAASPLGGSVAHALSSLSAATSAGTLAAAGIIVLAYAGVVATPVILVRSGHASPMTSRLAGLSIRLQV